MSGKGPRPFRNTDSIGNWGSEGGEKRIMDKTIVTVTVHRAADMTPTGRKQIAAWLRRQASFLETEGEKCAKRFTARYCAR